MYERAEAIFRRIEKSLLPDHKGKIIMIEPDSGDYVFGDNEVGVAQKAIRRHPKKKFGIFRIGYRAVHKIGRKHRL